MTQEIVFVIFMLVILKIPLVYVSWVLWWAVKAEPEIGAEGEGQSFDSPWQPWRKPRPPRNGPHETPTRATTRATRHERKAIT